MNELQELQDKYKKLEKNYERLKELYSDLLYYYTDVIENIRWELDHAKDESNFLEPFNLLTKGKAND